MRNHYKWHRQKSGRSFQKKKPPDFCCRCGLANPDLRIRLRHHAVLFDVSHNILKLRERKPHIAVRTSVVDGDPSALRIVYGCAGEAHVGNKSPLLIPFLRCQKEILTSVFHNGRILEIQDRPSDGIHETVAGPTHAVVEQKPSLAGLNGCGSAADFDGLPPFLPFSHHMSVLSPINKIRALAQENISEGRMAAVRGPAEQHVVAVNLPRKKHGIAVKRDKGILKPGKGLEVRGLSHSDGCAVKILAPDNIVGILHLHQPGIIGIHRHEGLARLVHKGDFFLIKFPMDGILAPAHINIGNSVGLLPPEHADKRILIGHHRTVKNSRNTLHRISPDNGIFRISPDRGPCKGLRPLLPGYILYNGCNHFHFAHHFLFSAPYGAVSIVFICTVSFRSLTRHSYGMVFGVQAVAKDR